MLNTTTVKTKPTHKNLGRNAASAIISGCLALSLCPAIAFAAPGGEPPAMMQDSGYQDGSFNQGMPPAQSQNGGPSQSIGSPSDQNGGGQPTGQGNGAPQGQAPDMQQPANGTPDGQQPAQQPDSVGAPAGQPGGNGMQGGRNDQVSDQVRSTLSESYGVSTAQPAQDQAPNGSKPSEEPPTLLDGEINVQQIIDSVRDMMRHYGLDALQSADFSDSQFNADATEYVTQANATRFTQDQNQQAPADLQDDTTPIEKPDEGDAAPTDTAADKSLIDKLVAFVMGIFGQQA